MAKGTTKIERQLTKASSIISAVLVIISAIAGLFAWINTQFQNVVTEQINVFQESIKNDLTENKQSSARIELMMLMEHDPDNVVAIEQTAKYYFRDLKGDRYMTGRYSTWAKEHGGDTSIVIGDK